METGVSRTLRHEGAGNGFAWGPRQAPQFIHSDAHHLSPHSPPPAAFLVPTLNPDTGQKPHMQLDTGTGPAVPSQVSKQQAGFRRESVTNKSLKRKRQMSVLRTEVLYMLKY